MYLVVCQILFKVSLAIEDINLTRSEIILFISKHIYL